MPRISRMWIRRALVALAIVAAPVFVVDRFVIPHVMAGVIVTAPNPGEEVAPDPETLHPEGVRRITGLRVPVGPPEAVLDVEVLGPGPDARVRGTILVLHGLGDSKRSQTGIGAHWVRRGYRSVLVDHRGQGRSTGHWLTYGVRESRDLVQLLDELNRTNRLVEPVGVLGFSYGGAVAIQFAARDPRVKAVVSVSAFSSLREVLPPYARRFTPWAAWWFSDRHYDRALRLCADRAGFDPAAADTAAAAGRTSAPILIVHGRGDRLVPPVHAERIRDAAGDHGELVLVDGDHLSVCGDQTGEVRKRATRWFDRWLGND